MVQKVAVKRKFEASACDNWKTLSTLQLMEKGEGWAPPFISFAQDTVGL